MVDRAHQGHGDVIELTSRPARVADGVLSTASKRVDLIDKEKHRLAGCCLSEYSLYVLASRSDPAGKQFWSGYVFKVQPELASGRSCEEGFSGAARAVQEDSISHQPVTFVFFRIQMPLHDLADLFLCLFHAAEIGEPLRWHITNRLDRSGCRSLNGAADGRESPLLIGLGQQNLQKRNDQTDRGQS